MLVCIRRAAAHPFVVRPKGTGLQDWGMGAWTSTPSLSPDMGIYSFTFALSSTQPYIWGFLLCASGASRPLPPKEFGPECRERKGSMVVLKSFQLPLCG